MDGARGAREESDVFANRSGAAMYPASECSRCGYGVASSAPNGALKIEQAGRCQIILVHGTWGRGFIPKISDLRRKLSLFPPNKRWFEDDSPFHVQLSTALKGASIDWPIRSFLWSGANSIHARDRAARELCDQLRQDLENNPNITAIIIAHSHGGNVALRALQHLNSMTDRIRVITLATPFLRVFARKHLQLPFVVGLFLWILLYMIITVLGFGIAYHGVNLILSRITIGPLPFWVRELSIIMGASWLPGCPLSLRDG
jgi:hypothetical protein